MALCALWQDAEEPQIKNKNDKAFNYIGKNPMTSAEPCFDVAHLGHVELLSDKPEESLNFFVNVYGLTETGREGESIYLRAFDDYEFHTLKLTASESTGVVISPTGAAAPKRSSGVSMQSRNWAVKSAGPRESGKRARLGG